MNKTLWECVNLLVGNETSDNGARHILLTVCENILRSPCNEKLREVRLNGPDAMKLLSAAGAMESLFEVGFVEDGDRLLLPRDASLVKLEMLRTLLSTASTKLRINYSTGQCIVLPPGATKEEQQFLKCIIRHFRDITRYENLRLQQKARDVVPIIRLEVKAMERMREIQKNVKRQQMTEEMSSESSGLENHFSAKDLFLIELLAWFKQDFFKWIDKPACPQCQGVCERDTVTHCRNQQISRIEMYNCNNCKSIVEFPRYTDPEPLLRLRRGRCGEWANVFTLLCRSFGYDARLVHDQTDHVWTEVWSMLHKRWIHLDPCENAIDRPLMYEKGWHKELSYILAYSKDEVQDVTWRYTRDPVNVLKRRNLCSEQKLLTLIQLLNEQRQNSVEYSAARRRYVLNRSATELAEMLYIPGQWDADDDESYQGRTSGSYAWRLARGEVAQDCSQKNYTWHIPRDERSFEIRYFIVKDIYEAHCNSKTEEKSGWQAGVDVIDGIFRKVEDDWKMVYLTRTPETQVGNISWTFEVKDPNLRVGSLKIRARTSTFHGASITWNVEALFNWKKDPVIVAIPDCTDFITDKLKGAMKVSVKATLAGGEGDQAWQHAQLFRQSLESTEEPAMVITIQLCDA